MILEKNIPLRNFTTYKVGGKAEQYIFARTRAELIEALKYAQEKDVPFFVLGTGANILVSDKGFKGLVIRNGYQQLAYNYYQTTADYGVHFIRAGSGVTIERAMHFSRQYDLSGFEHFAGIPSTVGGALWQNLHFLNPERTATVFIEQFVHHATVFNTLTGDIGMLSKEDFMFGYDYSILHKRKHVVIDAVFQMIPSHFGYLIKQMRENIEWRNKRHPLLEEFPSCGSVFKKIENVGAGRLIEQAGLKEFQIGGAMVHPKHANFIVNIGNATAMDIYRVIRHVERVVFEKTGYQLETEIRLVGEFE